MPPAGASARSAVGLIYVRAKVRRSTLYVLLPRHNIMRTGYAAHLDRQTPRYALSCDPRGRTTVKFAFNGAAEADQIAGRAADERSENTGMPEHAAKAGDPVRSTADRSKRVGRCPRNRRGILGFAFTARTAVAALTAARGAYRWIRPERAARSGRPIERRCRSAPTRCTGGRTTDPTADLLNKKNASGQKLESERAERQRSENTEGESHCDLITIRDSSGAGCTPASEQGAELRRAAGTSPMPRAQ